MQRLIILHGKKLNSNGALSTIMNERIEILKTLLDSRGTITLIICGGKTRKNLESEARVVYETLKRDRIFSYNLKIMLEENSKTTAENIKNVKRMVGNNTPGKIEAITTTESVRKLKFLYEKLWPENSNRISIVAQDRHVKIRPWLT